MPRLVAALSLTVALFALSGCKGDPKTPEYWEKKLEGARKTSAKVQVVDALRTSGNLQEGFLPMLHARLAAEKRPEVITALARVLGDLKHPSSVEPLQAALDPGASDTDAHLANKELAAALGKVGSAKAAPALTKLLGSRDNYTRIEAIQALGALRAPEAVEPLLQLASDESTEPFLNKKAIEALGRIGDARAVPVLMRMLTKERQGVSFYVESSFALYQLGAPAADALLAALEGRDAELTKWAGQQGVHPASYAMKAAQLLGDFRDRRAEATLLKQLTFTNTDPRIQALVRMQAAEALGRMRTGPAARPLSTLVSEEDPTIRAAYVRALTLIGGREALPALEKAAGQGDWYARETAMRGLALLGDAREQPLFVKWAEAEPARTASECQDYGGEGCEDPAALAQKRAQTLTGYGKLLEEAKACGTDGGCWAQKVSSPDALVVERAALELGRGGGAPHAAALAGRVSGKDLEARSALLQSLDWLVGDSKEAAAKAREALPKLQAQLAEEKGNSRFLKVNEDLRRLIFRLERT
ncbi:HEAT repeat domain-containing protein [Stigmatella sp. ncwal1]|uniref:HEAT repeat domain-containing protein n=1 Tax=Stigmatella ashevillensis TaxID=2995309 RepID=A0ABT5DJU9_9BACT|nr:HEAT repeat domain-containing protein [Stigmatella ashevillena]MDC0713935.1 HEAT repeat domain-containing protein [Stigmatella ashevillena]